LNSLIAVTNALPCVGAFRDEIIRGLRDVESPPEE